MPRSPYTSAESAAQTKALFGGAPTLTFNPSESTDSDNFASYKGSFTAISYVRVYLRADSSYSWGAYGTYTIRDALHDADGYNYDTTLLKNGMVTVDKSGYYYIALWWRYVTAPGSFSIGVSEDLYADGVNTNGIVRTAVTHAFENILREGNGALLTDLTAKVNAGTLSKDGAIAQIVKAADATTSVATLNYQFFTGKTPTEGGYDYLVASTGPNPNNLNSKYYQSFNIENRYINFAVNLGKNGEGVAKFSAEYGNLSLVEATSKAYGVIFGATPTAEKVTALLAGGRDLYFQSYGGDGPNGIGTKAAMVGWLLAEAEKADIGMYARADAAYLAYIAANDAPYAIDLIAKFGSADYVFLG